MYCSRCQAHRTGALRREALWRLPPVLIVHFKRFHSTPHARQKLNARVGKERALLWLICVWGGGAVWVEGHTYTYIHASPEK